MNRRELIDKALLQKQLTFSLQKDKIFFVMDPTLAQFAGVREWTGAGGQQFSRPPTAAAGQMDPTFAQFAGVSARPPSVAAGQGTGRRYMRGTTSNSTRSYLAKWVSKMSAEAVAIPMELYSDTGEAHTAHFMPTPDMFNKPGYVICKNKEDSPKFFQGVSNAMIHAVARGQRPAERDMERAGSFLGSLTKDHAIALRQDEGLLRILEGIHLGSAADGAAAEAAMLERTVLGVSAAGFMAAVADVLDLGVKLPSCETAEEVKSAINGLHRIMEIRQAQRLRAPVAPPSAAASATPASSSAAGGAFVWSEGNILFSHLETTLLHMGERAAGKDPVMPPIVVQVLPRSADARGALASYMKLEHGCKSPSSAETKAICDIIASDISRLSDAAKLLLIAGGSSGRGPANVIVMQRAASLLDAAAAAIGLNLFPTNSGFQSLVGYSMAMVPIGPAPGDAAAWLTAQTIWDAVKSAKTSSILLGKRPVAIEAVRSVSETARGQIAELQRGRMPYEYDLAREELEGAKRKIDSISGATQAAATSSASAGGGAAARTGKSDKGCFDFRKTGACQFANCVFSHDPDAKCPKGPSCTWLAKGTCCFINH